MPRIVIQDVVIRLARAVALAGALALGACGGGGAGADPEHRVIVLGVDGMDPALLARLIEAGRMPNFAALAGRGTFTPLGTTMPPQSPVAWSSFISGADPGTHEIYDFIHRDVQPADPDATILPYLSTSRVEPPARDWALALGRWRVPLFGQRTVSLRRGGAFWDHLVAHGVSTTVYRVPANYPPPDPGGDGVFRCLCGMGTPDLLGTYGEFTLFTPRAPAGGRAVSGGRLAPIDVVGHRGRATLLGPPNHLRKPGVDGAPPPPLALDFEVVRDPEAPVARIEIDGRVVLLNEGEWSEWIPVRLPTEIPGAALLGAAQLPVALDAMVRVYLKQVHPDLELYVTPLNIDPLAPVNPIGAPGGFSREVAEACGRYYTTGIPEDTKALRAGALDEDEFLAQVALLRAERLAQYRHALARFERGLLFFYFGHTDQLSHVFWRDTDPGHPAHDPAEAARYGSVIEDAYVEMDGLLGEALAVLDEDDTIIVMSDHGFASFRRGFHLNTWLMANGYLSMVDSYRELPYLAGATWPRSRAYALGLNAVYLNLAGRERRGVVAEAERTALLREIAGKLRTVRDDDGALVVDRVYVVEDVYPDADPAIAPDLLVGYARNYRASWATAIGGSPRGLLEDNRDRWSGDHCIAHDLVPGILVTNARVQVEDPDLTDLAPTILREFGIAAPPEMTGRVLW